MNKNNKVFIQIFFYSIFTNNFVHVTKLVHVQVLRLVNCGDFKKIKSSCIVFAAAQLADLRDPRYPTHVAIFVHSLLRDNALALTLLLWKAINFTSVSK